MHHGALTASGRLREPMVLCSQRLTAGGRARQSRSPRQPARHRGAPTSPDPRAARAACADEIRGGAAVAVVDRPWAVALLRPAVPGRVPTEPVLQSDAAASPAARRVPARPAPPGAENEPATAAPPGSAANRSPRPRARSTRPGSSIGDPVALVAAIADERLCLIQVAVASNHEARWALHDHLVRVLIDRGVRYLVCEGGGPFGAVGFAPEVHHYQRLLGYELRHLVPRSACAARANRRRLPLRSPARYPAPDQRR